MGRREDEVSYLEARPGGAPPETNRKNHLLIRIFYRDGQEVDEIESTAWKVEQQALYIYAIDADPRIGSSVVSVYRDWEKVEVEYV